MATKVKVRYKTADVPQFVQKHSIVPIILFIVLVVVAYYYIKKNKLFSAGTKTVSRQANINTDTTPIVVEQSKQPGPIINKKSKLPDRFFYGDTWVGNVKDNMFLYPGQHLQRRGPDAPQGDGIYTVYPNSNNYILYPQPYDDETWNVKGSVQGDISGDTWNTYVDKLATLGYPTSGTGSDGRLIQGAGSAPAQPGTGGAITYTFALPGADANAAPVAVAGPKHTTIGFGIVPTASNGLTITGK
jgi:hypothetical protein